MTTHWYTITVVQHEKHPDQYVEGDTDKPVEVIACTVLPSLAATLLRGLADEIAPKKPTMRETGSRGFASPEGLNQP